MTAPLTLPGTIPGLLRRCSPVVFEADAGPLWSGLTGAVFAVQTTAHVLVGVLTLPMLARRESISVLSLDLEDETGRAHASWWLEEHFSQLEPGRRNTFAGVVAEHEVLRSGVDGIAYAVVDGYRGWLFGDTVFCAPEEGPEHGTPIPTLEGLNPEDPRTLGDGSSWVDAEALRRVCLHVAGVPDE